MKANTQTRKSKRSKVGKGNGWNDHECSVGRTNSLLIPCTDCQYRLFHLKPLQLLYHHHGVISCMRKEKSEVMMTDAINQ